MNEEECCLSCGLKGKKGDRRLLGSASNKHVMPLLLDVATHALAASGNVRLDEAKLSAGYICRPCFRALEKMQKLQQQVDSMRGDLYTKGKNAIPYLPTLPAHQSVSQAGVTQVSVDVSESEEEDRCSTSQLGRKCTSTAESPGSRKKRRLQLNKTRQTPVVSDSTTSPPVAVTVFYPKRARSYYMTPTRRRICKPLIRGNRRSLARQCLKDSVLRRFLNKSIGVSLQHEIAGLCSDKVESILRDKSVQALETFKWDSVMEEMQTRAPTLLSILDSCTKTRKIRKNRKAVIGIIAAILCKHRRPTASLLQRLISIVLYSGHASKSVYQRLQKLQVCLSHHQTLKVIDRVGDGFDGPVWKWKKEVEETMSIAPSQQVSGSRSTALSTNIAAELDLTIASTDSEGPLSFLDATDAVDTLTGPHTSTPVKTRTDTDLHLSSCDDSLSDSQSEVEVLSSSTPDSGSVTPPDFSALTCSGLSLQV